MKSEHRKIYFNSIKVCKRRRRNRQNDMQRLFLGKRISQSFSSRLDTDEFGLLSLAQLYISRKSSVQEPLPTINESAIPTFPTQEPSMHSSVPSPPPTQPSEPFLPIWHPPNDENGNSGGEIYENNNRTTLSNNGINTQYMAAIHEANHNFLRHYVHNYSQYSGLQH